MKAIIYAGIGLFAVASVYGVADYYSSQKKGTLDKLYKEEEEAPVEVTKDKVTTTVIPVKNVSTEVTNGKVVAAIAKVTKKTKLSRKKIRLEDFSRGRIDEVIMPVEVTKPVEVKKEDPTPKEDPVMEKVVAAGTETMAPPQPERKLSLEMFSRAPLKKTTKRVVKN